MSKYDDDEHSSWIIEDSFLLQCLHNFCFLLRKIFHSDEVIFSRNCPTGIVSRNLVQFRAL